MTKKIAVVTLLEGDLKSQVLRFWDLCELQYNSTAVRTFEPNMTFQVGTCVNLEELTSELTEVCKSLKTCTINIEGFGFFESPEKVIYLKVVPTEELLTLHRSINEVLQKHCEGTQNHYKVGSWVPHITIAMRDLSDTQFARAKEDLKDFRPRLTQNLTNLQLISVDSTGVPQIIQSWNVRE